MERVLEIVPLAGMMTDLPPSKIPLEASPEMLNFCVHRGLLKKRPGYTQFGTDAMPDQVNGIASVQDDSNGTHLFAMHLSGLQKYDSGTDTWTAMTGPALTGDASRLFSWDVSQNTLVFSQGLDEIMSMPFVGTVYAALATGSAVPAKYIVRAADRLILGHTLETGVPRPYRVRRAVIGDHTDWSGVGAGFTDLADFRFQLRGMRKFGARLIVYTEKSAYVGTRTGLASSPFAWDPILPETGLWVPFSLKGRRNTHILVGNDDVYEFDGLQLHPKAVNRVRGAIFDSINSGAVQQMFAEALPSTQEYMFFCATGGATTPNVVWVYNWGADVWYQWTVSGPSCAAIHRSDNSQTWDQLTETWDSITYEWDAFSLQTDVPTLLTGHTDGKVHSWGFQHRDDNGSAFLCRWTSRDLRASDVDPSFTGKQVTLKDVLFLVEAQGAAWSFTVEYSVDRGASWSGTRTVNVAAGDTKARVDFMVTGNEIRFRLNQQNTDPCTIHAIFPKIFEAGAWV